MQIRSDLFDFISGIGYQPVLSEYTSFPIDPDNDTIENCIQNVATSDILILILGGKYGHTIDTGKSITNTEYLYAKQIGLPIYVFIYKPLITILPVWSQNKEVDFSQTVDTPKVFEFVEELRLKNKSWCFEFEKAQDIFSTLKIQLSHLFKSALDLRRKMKVSDQPEYFKFLSPSALNLAVRKDSYFEPLFFLQVLKDELKRSENLKLDLDYKIIYACTREIKSPLELIQWGHLQIQTAQVLIESIGKLFKDAFPVFFGEPGVSSDLKGLYYIGCSLAKVFREMINWTIDMRSIAVHDDFVIIRDTLSRFMLTTIEAIWVYPENSMNILTDAQKVHRETGEHPSVNASIVLEVDSTIFEKFTSEMAIITEKTKLGYYQED